MERRGVRRSVVLTVVLCGLFAGLASTSTSGAGQSPVPAWCFDTVWWHFYLEGIPGSSSQEDFTDCLSAAAERGEILALPGKILERGALIEAGDGAVYWETSVQVERVLKITVYDDRVVFMDSCDNVIGLAGGTLAATRSGRSCGGMKPTQLTSRRVLRPDFTIFVVNRQFIATGNGGWYHINLDSAGKHEGKTIGSSIRLTARWPGLWITTDLEDPDPPGGAQLSIRMPLAGDNYNLLYYLVADWEDRVRFEFIPSSFSQARHDTLPDKETYWAIMKDVTDAIFDDLYRGRDDRPVLELKAEEWGISYADQREPFIHVEDATNLLNRIARVVSGPESGYGPRFAATLLMLWQRYVPGFDTAGALILAKRFGVEIGIPPLVSPESELTGRVNRILTQPAPESASDYEEIPPEQLHLSVTLEIGQSYRLRSDEVVVTSNKIPGCVVERSYSDGTTYLRELGPWGRFTVNPGGTWNGLKLQSFSNVQTGESGMRVKGTPIVAGRVRVEIMTRCPGGDAQETRIVGYSEIIVVDPRADEE